MYIYLIKCSIYFKIGFSKNPKNRLKTVKTHNPLEVKLFATLKTDRHLELEKELHNLFSHRNAKREWFELHEDDLLHLKIEYGFTFHVPINSIKNTEVKNQHVLNEIKELRIDNTKIDYVKSYFEQLFECTVSDSNVFKKCCLKFETTVIKETIDSLHSQSLEPHKAYDLLFKVCLNVKESKEDPSNYFAKICKAIYYKQFKDTLTIEEYNYLRDSYNEDLDINNTIRELNSKKFYIRYSDMWDHITSKYCIK